jgi:phosphoribosylanthranilate isomerase
MTAPLVKICGIRELRHARAAAEAGADMIGFVFAESRRRITPEQAHEIACAPYARRPRFVGVFVNEDPAELARLAAKVRLDLVQLSGDESPTYCEGLRLPYLKVLHVRDEMSAEEVAQAAALYPAAAAIVLDAAGSGSNRWGGTGLSIGPALAAAAVRLIGRPVMLAGGLRPQTVAEAIRAVQPWAVDVSGGVETDGVKDEVRIAMFVAAAKASAAGEPAGKEEK